jgi:hypothetical protein
MLWNRFAVECGKREIVCMATKDLLRQAVSGMTQANAVL